MANPANYMPRAERHAIPIAILYRRSGDHDWRAGLTENISRSGVLFRADRPLEPNTLVDLMLDLPSVVAPAAGGGLRRGRVVRAIGPSSAEHRPALAATFVDYSITPPHDPRRI